MAAQLARRRQLIDAGARHLGWKAGFASAAVRERLGTTGPLFGYLTDRGLLAAGSAIVIAGWTRPVLEAEVAVHLAGDVPAGASPDEVRAVVAGLGAALEVADLDPSVLDVEAILAGDIFHRHVVLGPPDASRTGYPTAGVTAVITADGAEVAHSSDPVALTGEWVEVLQQLASTLEDCGERLRSGDVVITGSLVAPVAVKAGPRYRAEIEPFGALEVHFQEGDQ
jgi:2-keto-4-pentenoate hydratase